MEYDSLRKGVGSLNAKGAIDLARTINTAMPTGSGWLASTPAPWTKIGNENLDLWGTTIGLTAETTAWKDLGGGTQATAQ